MNSSRRGGEATGELSAAGRVAEEAVGVREILKALCQAVNRGSGISN